MLSYIDHGEPTAQPGLLIAHGLYGSARNWGVIAKRLSERGLVRVADMSNHGASPWFDTHSYEDLAADLAEVIVASGGVWDVMGHSMGGKAAMVLALTRPELVNRLIVVDIAPAVYGHSQIQYIEAMQSVDLAAVERRSDAATQLLERVDNPDLVPFFLQALDVKQKRWLLNLDTLARDMPKVMGFPALSSVYEGKCLFLTGAQSDYVAPGHRARIMALFPRAQFAEISGAGHWLHAEKPREFEAALRAWLD